MENNKTELKELPKNIKFATYDKENEKDILLEFLIANLIHKGASFELLLSPIELIENKKEMRTKITNITLHFISQNPKSAEVLKQNDRAHQFLKLIST